MQARRSDDSEHFLSVRVGCQWSVSACWALPVARSSRASVVPRSPSTRQFTHAVSAFFELSCLAHRCVPGCLANQCHDLLRARPVRHADKRAKIARAYVAASSGDLLSLHGILGEHRCRRNFIWSTAAIASRCPGGKRSSVNTGAMADWRYDYY